MEPANPPRTPLAERNRRAKMRFLAGIKKHYEAKRQTSVESLVVDQPKKVDLTVPGTPVSSRYLRSLSKPESDTEEAKEPVELPNEIVVSSLVIDKFLKDMKGLDAEEQQAEVVVVSEEDGGDGEGEMVGEIAQEYFKQSDQQQAYQRSFSKAAQTLYTAEVKSPVVKRYFEESSAKQTYSREFSEAFNELDPAKAKADPLVDDSKSASRGYKSSVPGTPISSKNLHKLLNKNYISDSSDDEGDGPTSTTLADPLEKFIKDMDQLKALKESNMAKIEKQPLIDFSVDEYMESSKEAKTYARTFSQAAQTLNASEVKNPVLKDYFDRSEEMKTFRRDFSEVYQELSEKPAPAEVDAGKKKENKVEPKIESKPDDEAEKILKEILETKFEPPKLEKREFKEDFSVDAYLNSSDTKKQYARTFSEAAQTLHESDVKNPAVREYFDQSEAKQSFRREFSEVYQEVLNVTEFARDVVAEKSATVTTKVASSDQQQQQPPAQVKDNEQSEKSISRSANTEDDGSSQVAQYKRSVSVPGTPINSRKLFPKQQQQQLEAKISDSTYYAKTEIPLTPRLHSRNRHVERYFAASLFRRRRRASEGGGGISSDSDDEGTNRDDKLSIYLADASNNGGSSGAAPGVGKNRAQSAAADCSLEKEFWKKFGASEI